MPLSGGAAYSSDNISADNSFLQPTIRYYLNPSSTRLNFFASLSPSINLGSLEDSRINLNLGANRFISRELSLEGSLNYSLGGGTNLVGLALFARPFLQKGARENANPGNIFQKGNLIIQQNIAEAFLFRDNLSLTISPGLALFLTDRTLLGGQLTADIFLRSGSGQSFDASNLLINVYVRQYLQADPKKWNWFGEGGLTYRTNESSFRDDFNFQGQDWTLYASLGASIFNGRNDLHGRILIPKNG